MPATRLVLALTEEALLTSPASLPAALREVRAAGVRICLDDFGMGQTLFAHLSRVPLDSVRVDVGSLGARGDAARAVQIVSAIVASAETLGLTTVAHGVDPGPPLDAVLAAGATIVRSTAHPHLVALADVPRAVAGLLRRQVSPERGPAGPAAGSILAR
jgi:EAL domain-containing protein (putative c-di-GMP-specific phosphodiesterase class I)